MGQLTKRIISDQVIFKLSGGLRPTKFPVDERDVWKALEQKINSLFKLKHFEVTLPSGELIPENTMIATYEGNTVTSINEWSTAQLPVIPISFPRNMGIFLIYDPAFPDVPFIPIQRGQSALLGTDALLSDLMGQISYEPKNNIIKFNKDITTFGITEVTMELCVLDMSQYGITDILPIPSDYEERIVMELIQEFAPVLAKNGIVNNWTTAGQQQPIKQ